MFIKEYFIAWWIKLTCVPDCCHLFLPASSGSNNDDTLVNGAMSP
jgi:hypothetical protein